MRQIQGGKGEAVVSKLLRTLDNAGDGVSSAFPKGKQNENLRQRVQFSDRSDTKFQIKPKI